jgi:hypothetical protein
MVTPGSPARTRGTAAARGSVPRRARARRALQMAIVGRRKQRSTVASLEWCVMVMTSPHSPRRSRTWRRTPRPRRGRPRPRRTHVAEALPQERVANPWLHAGDLHALEPAAGVGEVVPALRVAAPWRGPRPGPRAVPGTRRTCRRAPPAGRSRRPSSSSRCTGVHVLHGRHERGRVREHRQDLADALVADQLLTQLCRREAPLDGDPPGHRSRSGLERASDHGRPRWPGTCESWPHDSCSNSLCRKRGPSSSISGRSSQRRVGI